MSELLETSAIYENTNGMPMSNGKNLHMETGIGELASRIITVGHAQRAEKISHFLDRKTHSITSSRGFTTITGYYNGVHVSIVSIGMGPSMMDFFVRESRAVVTGPMAIIRFGTCGGISTEALPGSIVVASGGSGYITRNPDAFHDIYENSDDTTSPLALPVPAPALVPAYNMHKIAPAHAGLSSLLTSELISNLRVETNVVEGVNVTAESFYSSQGRIDDNFDDRNSSIIASITSHYPGARSLEMETFMLLHLARSSKVPIFATAAAIVVANRKSAKVVDSSVLDKLEEDGGLAILKAITSFVL